MSEAQNLIELERQIRKQLAYLNAETYMFIKDNPTPLFIRNYNAEKQAIVEFDFDPRNVENPDERNRKVEEYCK
jgi:hypothetical protein